MASDAILVDLSDPSPVTELVSQGPLNLLPKKKGRSSFYSLPKTLSEDDDPFGILSKTTSKVKESVGIEELEEREILREEPRMGLLVQIDADSPTYSESMNSVSSINSLSSTSHMLGVSALAVSQTGSGLANSAHGVSGLFGNLSKISTASQPPGNITPSFCTAMSDDVFGEESSQAESKADDEPNWDKLMNEAQFVALKISDPGVPMKTPIANSRVTLALSNYSPCENVESPTALLDINQSGSDNFLVQLTPDKSPKKLLTKEFDQCLSPNLVGDPKGETEETETKSGDLEIVSPSPSKELEIVESKLSNIELSEGVSLEENNARGKTLSVPMAIIEKQSCKENMEPPPKVKPAAKKPLLNNSKLNSVPKSKLNLKHPGSVTKKTVDTRKEPLRPVNKKLISATPVKHGSLPSTGTPALKNPLLASASKSLKFTPKNTGFRVAKRPSSIITSNSEASGLTTSSSTESLTTTKTIPPRTPQAKPKPQIAGVTRLNPSKPKPNATLPTGTNKPEPVKPINAKPSSLSKPSSMGRPSGLVRPGSSLNSTLGSLPRPNLGSMPKPSSTGIQRPGIARQASNLSQPVAGGRFSTPSMKRSGGVPVPNRSGLCLPSPQTISANSSLVCSTPAAPRPRQAKGPLPSPITNVKRRV